MDVRIKQLTILVSDMQRSVQFYRDILELTVISVSDDWSEFEAGSIHIALHPGRANESPIPEAGTDAGTLNIVLHVPDLEATCQDLRNQGIDVDGPLALEGLPPLATFSDPDGISFTLAAG